VIGPFHADAWYSAATLAAALGMSKQSLHNRRNARGGVPLATKINGKLFFRGADIVKWLEACREDERP
jgi:hypothetical protein